MVSEPATLTSEMPFVPPLEETRVKLAFSKPPVRLSAWAAPAAILALLILSVPKLEPLLTPPKVKPLMVFIPVVGTVTALLMVGAVPAAARVWESTTKATPDPISCCPLFKANAALPVLPPAT